MCFKQEDISTFCVLKYADQLKYFGSNLSSYENDDRILLAKA